MTEEKEAKKQKKGNWFARHKFMTVVLAVIALIIIVNVAASGGDKSNTDTSKTSATAGDKKNGQNAAVAKVGQAVRDGKFEFTVKSLKCKVPSVSDSSGYVTKKAQGQYCLLDVTVKNIGTEQQYFSEDDQKLFNAKGVEYKADITATLYKANNDDALAAQINPGNAVHGVLVYDIPKDQKIVRAELHDSAFSDGVRVDL